MIDKIYSESLKEFELAGFELTDHEKRELMNCSECEECDRNKRLVKIVNSLRVEDRKKIDRLKYQVDVLRERVEEELTYSSGLLETIKELEEVK
ncbi:MAG: hypothetical protein GY750_20820 [Lentisphaerae bacterium]|nr:hypothetical protein [Lentisphaerota bacterium]